MLYCVIIVGIAVFFVLIIIILSKIGFLSFESAQKRAGRQGEEFVSEVIREVMDEEDVLLTNIQVSFECKETELDNVIINNRGVFIIEVKNYSGTLIGDENDYEWIKNKYSYSGNFYQSQVKNPIKQVKRQVYILANYLKEYDINVWIDGYAFLLESNSPVKSEYVLETSKDIYDVLHHKTNNYISDSVKNRIVETLT